MGRLHVVVIDRERAIAEAIAAAIRAALPDAVVAAGSAGVHAARSDADCVVTTWPAATSSPRERLVILLAAGASPGEARAAKATEPAALVSRAEPLALVADAVSLAAAGASFVSPAVSLLLVAPPAGDTGHFTTAEMRVLDELATHPDTRSRVAHRLGISTSTLDNHVGAIKRKVLTALVTSGNGPPDGYLSMEALIGWATRQQLTQKT